MNYAQKQSQKRRPIIKFFANKNFEVGKASVLSEKFEVKMQHLNVSELASKSLRGYKGFSVEVGFKLNKNSYADILI